MIAGAIVAFFSFKVLGDDLAGAEPPITESGFKQTLPFVAGMVSMGALMTYGYSLKEARRSSDISHLKQQINYLIDAGEAMRHGAESQDLTECISASKDWAKTIKNL